MATQMVQGALATQAVKTADSANTSPLQALATAQSVYQLDSLHKAIQISINQLSGPDENNIDPAAAAVIGEYVALGSEITQYKSIVNNEATNDITKKLVGFRSRLSDLENKKPNTSGFAGTVLDALQYYIILSLYGLGPILAIILITNTFYNKHREDNMVNIVFKIFYSFWAAVWYPLVLFYGCIDPPQWRSTFMPLFETDYPAFWKIFSYNPRDTDIVGIEKGRSALRVFSMLLFLAFLYAYFFYNLV